MPYRTRNATAVVIYLVVFLAGQAGAADTTERELERRFARTIQPSFTEYCISCHGQEKPKADLDLSPFKSQSSVVSGFR